MNYKLFSVFNRMLLREIAGAKGQFFAVAAVMFFGITLFYSSYMAYFSLKESVADYYRRYNFLDYYAEARNITPEMVAKIKSLEGVEEAIGRISAEISAYAPPKKGIKDNIFISSDIGGTGKNSIRKITLRLISLPDRNQPAVNKLLIQKGAYFDSDDKYLCIVNAKFAEFYGLKKGDTIRAIINLNECDFKLSGTASGPEYILALKSVYSPLSDDFGIIYVKETAAQQMLGYQNSYNQVHVRFKNGADPGAVIDKIEKMLKPYGFTNGTGRDKQFSYKVIDEEIKNLQNTAVIFPSVFLTVAAIIIYIMQKRLVNNRRTQIGVMKAFGYTDAVILWHYIKFSLLMAACGSVPALFAGYKLGSLMLVMYNQVFAIPGLTPVIYWKVAFMSLFISFSFSFIASFNSVRRIIRIQPAQAMRMEPPEAGRNIFIERIKFIWNALSFANKMIVKNIFRNPQRTFLNIFGISATIMFFMISMFFADSIDFAFQKQFFEFQKQDYSVMFSKPVSPADLYSIESVPGVLRAEPVIQLGVEIIKGWQKRETALIGIPESTKFTKLINEDMEPISLPGEGIAVAHMLAKSLSIKKGDMVTIKTYIGNMKLKDASKVIIKKVRVAAITKQYAGVNCFMSYKALKDFIGEGGFATMAYIKTEKGRGVEVKKKLLEYGAIDEVQGRLDIYNAFMEQMKFMNVFVSVMIVFGGVMGFAIIFNSTLISIMERMRELASLKVLGYSAYELKRLLFVENILICIVSCAPGAAVGYMMCELVGYMFSNDLFALEIVIYKKTYLIAMALVFVCTAIAQYFAGKNINGLDMVEVLKSRE